MKKVLLALLLLCLALLGCQRATQVEALAPTPAATEAATPTPITPPSPSIRQVLIYAASPTPSPTVPPTPSPTPTPMPTPFTIVWMTDTQILSRDYPNVFNCIRDWVLENREKENIQFVIHTGDVIDAYSTAMFENAANALVPIFETIPGMVASGNHDVANFGQSQWYFTHRPYAQLVQKEGQTYRDGDAAYVTVHAGETKFLVFGIGYDVICTAWMNQVIAQHPDHVVIVAVHKGLQENGTFFHQTRAIFLDVMPHWPKFRLILCGHMRGSMLRTDWFDDDGDNTQDRSVVTMMFNYQDDRKKGLGFIRLLRFSPLDHSIEVLTYSPWYDQWGYPGANASDNHFTLENAW